MGSYELKTEQVIGACYRALISIFQSRKNSINNVNKEAEARASGWWRQFMNIGFESPIEKIAKMDAYKLKLEYAKKRHSKQYLTIYVILVAALSAMDRNKEYLHVVSGDLLEAHLTGFWEWTDTIDDNKTLKIKLEEEIKLAKEGNYAD